MYLCMYYIEETRARDTEKKTDELHAPSTTEVPSYLLQDSSDHALPKKNQNIKKK